MAREQHDGRGALQPIRPNEEAFCFLLEKSGKARFTLVGVARVVVVEVDTALAICQGEAYSVRIIGANPSYMEGRTRQLKRSGLFANSSKEERKEFYERCASYWPAQRKIGER